MGLGDNLSVAELDLGGSPLSTPQGVLPRVRVRCATGRGGTNPIAGVKPLLGGGFAGHGDSPAVRGDRGIFGPKTIIAKAVPHDFRLDNAPPGRGICPTFEGGQGGHKCVVERENPPEMR